MILALAALVILALALPHVLRARAADPGTMVLLWSSNLGLRALTGISLALYLVLFLPATGLFAALTHWCWHAVVPLVATHLGFSGHGFGDVATLLPFLALAGSLAWLTVGVWRFARAVQGLVRRAVVGSGPRDSLIVGGADVVVATAGLARPRILVSAGALTQLDDQELAAGLEHERGHIHRGHRWIVVYGEICRALGGFVPGTRRALRELHLHLERDADRWALRATDRLALASAIVKAATSSLRPSPALTALGGRSDHLQARISELLAGEPARHGGRLRALALASCAAALFSAAALPAAIASGAPEPPAATQMCAQ